MGGKEVWNDLWVVVNHYFVRWNGVFMRVSAGRGTDRLAGKPQMYQKSHIFTSSKIQLHVACGKSL